MAYPSIVDTFAARRDYRDLISANHINQIQEAIRNIETELGIDPAGQATDVKTRLLNSLAINVKDYGAVGNGTTDDTNAIKDAITAANPGQTLFFPNGNYLLSQQITVIKNINLRGQGNSSILVANLDAATNLITAEGLQNVTWENFAIAGASNSNKNALRIYNTHWSNFNNIAIWAGSAEASFRIDASLMNTYQNCITSVNFSLPVGGGLPLHGFYLTSNAFSTNASALIGCIAEGLLGDGIYQNVNRNGNIRIIHGTYETCIGYGIRLIGGYGMTILGVHLEGNGQDFLAKNVNEIRLLGDYLGDVTLENVKRSAFTGVFNAISIDPDCEGNVFENIRYGVLGGDMLDNGKNTQFIGGSYRSWSPTTTSVAGLGFDPENIFTNGSLTYWPRGNNDYPEGISKYGNTANYEKTGIGQADTEHHISDYALKFTAIDAVSARISIDSYIDYEPGEKYNLAVWVKNPVGNTGDLELSIFYNNGVEIIRIDTTTIRDEWTKLQGTFEIKGGYSSFFAGVRVTTGHFSNGDSIYISDISLTRGDKGVNQFMIPVGNYDRLLLTGQNVFGRSSAPTSGTYQQGDIVLNSQPAAGGTIGWVCISSGSPGTWIPCGLTQLPDVYGTANVTPDRSIDANNTTLDEIADVLGTLINDLQSAGIIKS